MAIFVTRRAGVIVPLDECRQARHPAGTLPGPKQARVAASHSVVSEEPLDTHRIFKTSFASVYPHYVQKAEKKGGQAR